MRKKMSPWAKLYFGLVMMFLYVPIAVLITFSFNASKSRTVWTGFTLDWYKELFHNEQILSALMTTLIVSVAATLISTVLGTAAAIGIHHMNKKVSGLVLNLTYLPIINPEILTGVSLMLLFVFLKIELGYTTLILAHITFDVPYVILSVMPKLRQMDKHINEAAMDLGCTPVQAFFKASLPQIMPGVITGGLMAFTYSLDDFVVSYFTHGASAQPLSVQIFAMTRRKVSPEINALSTIIFIVVLLVLLVSNLLDARKERKKNLKYKEIAREGRV